jgi:DNA repair exonuclease SbcCD ATPase subunit
MLRDAERAARQLTLESEQRAYQLTTEAEERSRLALAEAEQRSKQVTLEAAQRVAELEQQLTEVRDNLESARAQIEEQVTAIRGQVEMARATLNTMRQQLASGSSRAAEANQVRATPVPRMTIPPLSAPEPPPAEEPSQNLNDLRAAVDALKRPRRPEPPPTAPPEPEAMAKADSTQPIAPEEKPDTARRA